MIKSAYKLVPGLMLVLIVAVAAYASNEAIKSVVPLEAVTIAIIIGMVLANTVNLSRSFKPGLKFGTGQVLQFGIILLGFKLNFGAVMQLGVKTLVMIAIFTPLVIWAAYLLGKALKISGKIPVLVGIGSGVCGASAIVAMSPVVRAKDEDAVVAVSIVNFLGAIGVLVYSFIASQQVLTVSQYGIWSGISLQGVAHALAAAFAGGSKAGELATIVKMGRVLMLVPVALFFSIKYRQASCPTAKVKFPYYVLFFVLSGVVNSLGLIPASITTCLARLSGLLILLAMAAMGLTVKLKAIRQSGASSLLMGSMLFLVIASATFALVRFMY